MVTISRGNFTQVKGIGPWTADIYLLMALRRPDIWPCGDLALKAALKSVKRLAEVPQEAVFSAMGRPWRPWRAIDALPIGLTLNLTGSVTGSNAWSKP